MDEPTPPRIGRWVTRAGSAALLMALLGGIPWGLITLVGWPLPRQVRLPGTVEELQQIAATPLTDDMIIKLLAVAMWLIWGTFAASFLGEVAAAARGAPARRLPVVAPVQKLAGWLLSGITAGVLAAATLTPAMFLPPPPPAAAAEAVPTATSPTADHSAGPAAQQQPPHDEQPPVLCAGEHILVIGDQRYAYEVQRGDSLWRIAELCLGDGADWPAIWELNQSRHFPQVGGSLHNPHLIYPGWDLHLPADAVPPADAHPVEPPAPEPPPAPESPPVPEPPPAAESPPAPVPPQQPTPTPPAAPSAEPTPPSTHEPNPPPALTPGPSTAAPPAAPPPSSSPATNAAPAPSDPPGAAAEPPSEAGQPGDAPPDDDHSGLPAAPIAFGAALIAATLGVTAAVKLRRRGASADRRAGRPGHQPRHRPHRIDHGNAEQQLRAAAQPLNVDQLDTALRHLSTALANRAGALPDIIGFHIEPDAHHLVLASPCQPAEPPWRANHARWTLDADLELPHADGGNLAAVPALVTIGSRTGSGTRTGSDTRAGDEHLLLDLERLGCLSITGDPDAALELLRYLASELAMNTWSDDVEIILAGWPPDDVRLLTALSPDRIRASDLRVRDAVAELRTRVQQAAAALTAAGATDALAGRVYDLGGDSWMPTVLLVAEPQPADLEAIADLAADLANVGRSAVAAAVIGEIPARDGRAAAVHAITIGPDGTVDVPFLDVSLSACGLPLDELEQLAQVISTAREGRQEPVPPAPEPEPWARGTDAAGALLPPHQEEPAGGDATLASVDHLTQTQPALGADDQPSIPAAYEGSADLVGWTDVGGSPAPAGGVSPAAVTDLPLPGRTGDVRPTARPADATLDADLQAWRQLISDRPCIRILGPVTDAHQVIDAPGQPPKPGRLLLLAEVLVYLAQCGSRGASPDRLDRDLWPGQEVKVTYRRATLSRARQWAGRRDDGTPWLAEIHYRLEDGYLLDWHLFRRLRARGQAHGPAGINDLRTALELVRGMPLEGYERIAATTRSPYSWLPTSDIDPDHLIAAIIDTAHELAQLYLAHGDTAGARWAVQQAWLADPDRNYDQPWLDLLCAQAADGHQAELAATVRELMRAREAEVEEDLDPTIYTVLRDILPSNFWDRLPVG